MLRPFAHPVACCWMLLRVVVQSLKPVKLFSQQLPTFLLFRDRRSVAQQCWIRLHSFSNTVGAAHAHNALFTKDLCVVSFPRCTAGPIIVGSCCIRLQTTANTHATTPNIVGASILGDVASIHLSKIEGWDRVSPIAGNPPKNFNVNWECVCKMRDQFLDKKVTS